MNTEMQTAMKTKLETEIDVLHCSDERNKVQNAVFQWISLTPFNFYISFNICVRDGKKKVDII